MAAAEEWMATVDGELARRTYDRGRNAPVPLLHQDLARTELTDSEYATTLTSWIGGRSAGPRTLGISIITTL
jgi:hypothetical protein